MWASIIKLLIRKNSAIMKIVNNISKIIPEMLLPIVFILMSALLLKDITKIYTLWLGLSPKSITKAYTLRLDISD